MKRILVTGGAGFIGSHTVDFLLKQDMQVVVLDNLATGKLAHLNLTHPCLKFVQADLLAYDVLRAEIAKSDAVLHLAALSSVPQSITNPFQSLQINTLGFLHVLQAIREIGQPIRLVYASSAAVYGNTTTLPCSDDVLPDHPFSPYALEKASNERYAALYAELFGVKSLGLRYFNVYGSRQDPSSPYSGVITKFMNQYRCQEPITVFGNGEQSRDFIHVSDVARANELALQSDYCGVLNIATGVPETLHQLVQYIEAVGTMPAHVMHVAARIGDIEKSYAKVDKANTHLAFHATVNLAQGMRLMMESGGA